MKNTIRVYDALRFYYSVDVEHFPYQGYSVAYYEGRRIAQIDTCRLLPPWGDDDAEHEAHEEQTLEWAANNEIDLKRLCQEHFNQK